MVEYNCRSGYEILGSDTLECRTDGSWNDSQPVCGNSLANLKLLKSYYCVGKKIQSLMIHILLCKNNYLVTYS